MKAKYGGRMLSNIDVFLFQFVNQTMRNPVCDSVMPLISQYGYYTWLGLVGLVVFFDKRSGINNAHLLLTSLLAGWVITEEVLKPLFTGSALTSTALACMSTLCSLCRTMLPFRRVQR